MSAETKFAHLGKPGSAFSQGFARRFELMQQVVDFHDKKILDVGCGEGVWLEQFAKFTPVQNIYGSDFDAEMIEGIRNSEFGVRAGQTNAEWRTANLRNCPAEALDFPDNSFDIVFSNEVLEHVQDDRQSVKEAVRVLKPGGQFIIFTPNRGWPFETHGMFLGEKYYWGNIPLLPWMPKFVRTKFAPHVRNYSNGDIRRLFDGLSVKVAHHTHVFPGFDGMVRRFGLLGRIVQKFMHLLEKTPLHWFGISHFVVIEKPQ